MADGPTLHRRHGFYLLVMVIGWVLPPIAVLLRFGFGSDFFINILLTLCGYIPGHGHNFYLQNIRNNENRRRTPAWASRAGLVKDPSAKRKVKTQWANRYDERTPTRADGYQDEDEQQVGGRRGGGSGLLEPEVFMDSSSAASRSSYSQPPSSRDRPSPGARPRSRDPNSASVARRISSANHPRPSNPDDRYFVRRASTISLAASHNRRSRIDPRQLHSPTSVKSFPAKLGFSSRPSSAAAPKDRIFRSEPWLDENHQRRSPSPAPSSSPARGPSAAHGDDGLNHQF